MNVTFGTPVVVVLEKQLGTLYLYTFSHKLSLDLQPIKAMETMSKNKWSLF